MEKKNSKGETKLQQAVIKGDADQVAALLKAGANVNVRLVPLADLLSPSLLSPGGQLTVVLSVDVGRATAATAAKRTRTCHADG